MSTLTTTLTSYVPTLIARRLVSNYAPLEEPVSEVIPAIVLFADISGFTPLTEQLAERGPAGMEELSRILNAYFGQLIELVTAYGGDVVKFAGDALLAVWPTEQEEQIPLACLQAAQCALSIQRQLETYRHTESHQLFLKIGLSTGQVTALHLGGLHGRWEFIVTGQPLREVAQAEHYARPGQVVVTPGVWQHLTRHGSGNFIDNGFMELLSLQITTPITAIPPIFLPADSDNALRSYIPGAIKTRLDAGQTAWLADLRRVTVLFASMPALTELSTLEQAQQVVRTMQETLYRYEGSVNKINVDDKGVTMVAALGLPPLSHEDDPVLGVQAALGIHKALAELGFPSAIGVTTGRAFCGTIGNDIRREYTMIGDVVNLSARLMQAATRRDESSPEVILCDYATFEAAQSRLEFDTLNPIEVKGKRDPVAIFCPRGEKRQRIEAPEAPAGHTIGVVGRQKERDVLENALQKLKEGQTSVILLEGEAGLGKSYLLGELKQKAQLQQITVLSGAGSNIEQSASYHGWRGIFAQMFDIGILADPEAQRLQFLELLEFFEESILPRVPLLNPVLPFNFADNELTAHMEGQTRADNTREILIKLLQTSVERSPKLLILEDAHWLDSASWNLAVTVSKQVSPVLLVLSTRPLTNPPLAYLDLLNQRDSQHIQLNPMNRDEILSLVVNRLGVKHLPKPVADLIVDKGEGNPFFSEELAYALRDSKDIILDGENCYLSPNVDLQSSYLPTTVQSIITSRIDRLPPAEQLTLKVASVIGRFFPFSTLRHIFPIADDKPHLSQYLQLLEEQALTSLESTEPEPAYAFKHIVTQEVAYNLLLFEQRRQLHQAVAEWYEMIYGLKLDQMNGLSGSIVEDSSFIIPLLVHHHHHAGNLDKERHYAKLAGEQSSRQFANEEAIQYFSRVLELTPKTKHAERYELLMARQHVYHTLGKRTDQAADLEALYDTAEALNDDRFRAAVAIEWAIYGLAVSNFNQAAEQAQLAIGMAELLADAWCESNGYLHWGIALMELGEYEAATQKMERALYLAQINQLREVEASCLRSLGQIFGGQGDAAKARGYYMQALMIRREIGDKRGEGRLLNNLGRVARQQGDFERALSYHEQALRLNQEIGAQQGVGQTLDELGSTLATRGNYHKAMSYAEEAFQIKRQVSDRQGEAVSLNVLGTAAMNLGDYASAEHALHRALRRQREVGDRRGQGQTLNNLGTLAHLQGQYKTAMSYYVEALPLQREMRNKVGEAWLYNNMGAVSLAEGRYDRAQAYFSYTLTLQRRLQYRKGQVISLNNLGHVARLTENSETAVRHFESAVRLAQEIRYPKGECYAWLYWSSLYLHQEQWRQGLEMAQNGMKVAQTMEHKSLQAYALFLIGRAQLGLGDADRATILFQQAIDSQEKLAERQRLIFATVWLGQAHWQLGNRVLAMQQMNLALKILRDYGADFSEFPWEMYVTMYQILEAQQDIRARDIAKDAQQKLNNLASKIEDPAGREQFLSGVHQQKILHWQL